MRLGIPVKVKIAGYTYTCDFSPILTRDSDSLGSSCGNSMKISIDSTVPRENQVSALLHEILEQLNWRYELKLEHRQITVLESAFYQVIQDNPDIFGPGVPGETEKDFEIVDLRSGQVT